MPTTVVIKSPLLAGNVPAPTRFPVKSTLSYAAAGTTLDAVKAFVDIDEVAEILELYDELAQEALVAKLAKSEELANDADIATDDGCSGDQEALTANEEVTE